MQASTCGSPWGVTLLVGLLGLVPAAHGQQIPVKGTDGALEVATWNIEWFGSASNGPADDAGQQERVQTVIEQAGIDLWAVQEISNPDAFTSLLDALGDGFDGVLATESGQQRIGFVYRTDVVTNVVVQHILSDFAVGTDNPFAGRAPLQLEADVVLPDTTLRLTFVTVHMKCCADASSYERRVEAARRLKNHLDFLRPRDPVVVLGDLNDGLTASIRSGQPSPYRNFLDDPDDYTFLSLPLEEAGLGTFCTNSTCSSTGSAIDHILVTDELAPAYAPGTAARFDELASVFNAYGSTTSDHLPVYARFRFGAATATEPVPQPAVLTLAPAYPNPFSDRVTVPLVVPRPGRVRAEVYDALGRRVAVLADGFRSAGTHPLVLDADLPPGLYLVRVAAAGAVATQRVVRGR